MFKLLRVGAIVGLAAVLLADLAHAQARRWSVSGAVGVAYGTSTEEIEAAMVAAGLDDPSGPSLGFPGTSHPTSFGGNPRLMGAVSYALGSRFGVRALLATADLGATHGYRDGPGFGTYMFLGRTVTTLAVLPTLGVGGGGFRVGAGPSLNRVKVEDLAQSGSGFSETSMRPGLLAEVGLSIPARSRIFIDLSGQYRYASPADIGPIEKTQTAILSGEVLDVVRFPRTRVSFSAVVLSLGLGVRF